MEKNYIFKLQYNPEKDRLFNSFYVMSHFLEAQEKSSNLILSILDTNSVAYQQLDFIQKGSLIVKIYDILKSLNDDEIRNKGLIYIGREVIIAAKNALIEYIEKKRRN